jgi:hypothetical protein
LRFQTKTNFKMKKIIIAVFALSMGISTVNAQTSKATTATKPAVQQSAKPVTPAKSATPQKEVAPAKATKPVQSSVPTKAEAPAKSKLQTVSPGTKTKKDKASDKRVNDKKNMKQAPKLKGTKSAVPQQKQAKKN